MTHIIEQLQVDDRDILNDALNISVTNDMQSIEIVHEVEVTGVEVALCFDFDKAYQSSSDAPIEFIDIFPSEDRE